MLDFTRFEIPLRSTATECSTTGKPESLPKRSTAFSPLTARALTTQPLLKPMETLEQGADAATVSSPIARFLASVVRELGAEPGFTPLPKKSAPLPDLVSRSWAFPGLDNCRCAASTAARFLSGHSFQRGRRSLLLTCPQLGVDFDQSRHRAAGPGPTSLRSNFSNLHSPASKSPRIAFCTVGQSIYHDVVPGLALGPRHSLGSIAHR